MLDFTKQSGFSERRCKKMLLRKVDADGGGLMSEAEFVQFFAGLTSRITDEDEINRGIVQAPRYTSNQAAPTLRMRNSRALQQG